LLTYLISAFALFDDLKGIEWFTILPLPAFYSAAVALFYFLLPANLVSQIVIVAVFGLGMYALYLTENIYSVAAIRTIQLLRAAHAVGFLISILTLILFYNTIFSLRLSWYWNGLMVGLITIPVMLQGLWSIQLLKSLTKSVVIPSIVISLIAGEIAVFLSFVPVTVWIAALFLGTFIYVVLGLLQQSISDRLFVRTMYEYLAVGGSVLIASLLVMPWK
jgi:hypothetical protein